MMMRTEPFGSEGIMGAELVPATVNGALTAVGVDADARRVADAWLLGFKPATRALYDRDVTAWLEWCAAGRVPPLAAMRHHVEGWTRLLDERDGFAPATIARRLSAVSSFYTYARDADLVARNPVENVRRPKVGRDSPRLGLSTEESRALLNAAQQHSRRAYLLTCLLLLNGLRVSEALNADLADVTVEQGQPVLRVRRKGGWAERVSLPAQTVAALTAYRETRGEAPGPLLLNARGGRWTRQAAANLVGALGRRIGKPKLVPHDLRATAVTRLLASGMPLHEVQDFAGHNDPRTTRRYDRAQRQLHQHPAHRLAALLA